MIQKLDFILTSTAQIAISVPGGLQTSEKYYGTTQFKIEIENFKKTYLCGICRDAKHVKKKN